MKNLVILLFVVFVFVFGAVSPAFAAVDIQPSLTGKKFVYVLWDYELMKSKRQFSVFVTGTDVMFPDENSQEFRDLKKTMLSASNAEIVEKIGSNEILLNFPTCCIPTSAVSSRILSTLGKSFKAEIIEGLDLNAEVTVRGVWETNHKMAKSGAMLIYPLNVASIPSDLQKPTIYFEPGRESVKVTINKAYEVKLSKAGQPRWYSQGRILQSPPKEWLAFKKYSVDLPKEVQKYF